MSCPRCDHPEVTNLADSPVPGVWHVLQCARCRYTWRTTEPKRRTDRATYPDAFRLTLADITSADEVPAVPPLESRA
ncbi:non-oxidative hydroxyarylic acid decarboxylases subunit D [Amycolatopsis sp. NPDC051903]|uniref:non-oxidative hydroxyarylic acid decarboxylases subunit D n=1 Tax=Amycolatopsis sp. NPDC051903 TaxID=3363936 RepID=UPI00378C64C8